MRTPRRRDVERFLPLSAADLQLLLLLSERPMHAYGITRAADAAPRTAVRLDIGSLYRMLVRMTGAGLIEERPPDPTASGNEAKRKYYRITGLGRRVLRAEVARMRDVVLAAARRNLVDLPDVST